MNIKLRFVWIIIAISVAISAIVFYMNSPNKTSTEDKRIITNAFNDTIILQSQIVQCFRETKSLSGCDYGKKGIQVTDTQDSNKSITVIDGVIYMAFTGGEMSKVLHGGGVVLSLDTSTALSSKPKWNCRFSNVHAEDIDMNLLPSMAHCVFDKHNQ